MQYGKSNENRDPRSIPPRRVAGGVCPVHNCKEKVYIKLWCINRCRWLHSANKVRVLYELIMTTLKNNSPDANRIKPEYESIKAGVHVAIYCKSLT